MSTRLIWMFFLLVVMLVTPALARQDMRPLWEDAAFGSVLEKLQARGDDPAAAQSLATLYTYMGRQDLAYEVRGRLPWPDSNCAPPVLVAESVPAVERILTETSGRRLVLFNENHFWIAPRAFLRSMLPALREQGFTHIGFEVFETERAVRAREGEQQEANWQFKPSHGSYSHEPVFAALIREARALDFQIFGYESGANPPESASMREKMRLRERTQAENILSVMDSADENARFLIFAGWSHIAKTPVAMSGGEGLWMAGELMEQSDVEPLSIELARCARVLPDDMAVSPSSPLEAVIPLYEEGDVVVGGHYSDSVDMQVHLPMQRSSDRAAGFYRQTLGKTVPVPRELAGYDEPVLVRAWREGQARQSVPLDQVWLRPGERLPLYLPAGDEYRLVAFNGNGEELAVARVRLRMD